MWAFKVHLEIAFSTFDSESNWSVDYNFQVSIVIIIFKTLKKYLAPDSWHETTPCHIILTLGRSVQPLPRKSELPSEEQLVPFLTTLVCRGPGSNPRPPVPRSGHSTNWATRAGLNIHVMFLFLFNICWRHKYINCVFENRFRMTHRQQSFECKI